MWPETGSTCSAYESATCVPASPRSLIRHQPVRFTPKSQVVSQQVMKRLETAGIVCMTLQGWTVSRITRPPGGMHSAASAQAESSSAGSAKPGTSRRAS